MRSRVPVVLVLAALLASACSRPGERSRPPSEEIPVKIADDIEARRAQFVPVRLSTDLSVLSDGDRQALEHLIRAADAIDRIFLRQVWVLNPEFASEVARLDGPRAQAARDCYRIHYGPWDRLRDFEPILTTWPHPDGAGYYPEDMTRQELEEWIESHPEDAEAFRSLHTVIRRSETGLFAIPYSEAYGELLEAAAAELEAAAAATTDPTLAKFLELRARAFWTDDYYESDMAWMDLAGLLEVVIGPYETYEDGLFGYKAAFEAFLCLAQPEDSRALAKYKGELPFLEQNLPIPDEHKNLDRGAESPIRVADEIYAAGDTRAGVQTLAFNLPNDERVREAKGSKKVLLKNVMHAKYDGILRPIAERVLPTGGADRLDFDAYFHFILFHELVHGVGPGRITVDGRETEVRLELKDLYSAFEEAKADVVGLYSLYALMDRGVAPEGLAEALPWTVVAGFFRSARFGIGSAHGQGVVLQVNYLIEKGAVEVNPDGKFRPILSAWRQGIADLSRELLLLQAHGDYEGARAFLKRYGTMSVAMKAAIDELEEIPVDIDPVFAVSER
jgi:hypothetical protein